jgi:hypothetical protein
MPLNYERRCKAMRKRLLKAEAEPLRVTRIGALVALRAQSRGFRGRSASDQLAVVSRLFADLEDGRRAIVPDRDSVYYSVFGEDAGKKHRTEGGSVEHASREVELRRELLRRHLHLAIVNRRRSVGSAKRWADISDAARKCGAQATSAELGELPFVVEFTDEVEARLEQLK